VPLRAPTSLDGAALSPDQRRRLQALIDVIRRESPTRTDAQILAHAEAAFRTTAKKKARSWADLPEIRLSGGKGPILRQKKFVAATR